MKYLLDTSVALWALGDKAKLSPKAKSIIDDTSILLCVSIISAWEIAIKVSIGKLNFNGGSELFLKKMIKNGIEVIGLTGAHIKQTETLPFIHRDPFDRLLVSAAKSDGMTIVTPDKNIRLYDVATEWD
jgi:PIN domain nuclease of toxin-antitoxin system